MSLFYLVHDKAWDLFSQTSHNVSSFLGKVPAPTIFQKFQKEEPQFFTQLEFYSYQEAKQMISGRRGEFSKFLRKIQTSLGPAHLFLKVMIAQRQGSSLLHQFTEESTTTLSFIDLSTGSSHYKQHVQTRKINSSAGGTPGSLGGSMVASGGLISSVRSLSSIKEFILDQGKSDRSLFFSTLRSMLFKNQKVTAILTLCPYSKFKAESESVLRFGRKIKEYSNQISHQSKKSSLHKKFSSDSALPQQQMFKKSLLQSQQAQEQQGQSRRSDSLPSERVPSFGLRKKPENQSKMPLQALLQKITLDPPPLEDIQEEMKNEGESERFQFLQSPEHSISQTLVSYCEQPGAEEPQDTYRVEEQQARTASMQTKEELYRQRKQKYKERRESKLKSSPNVTFNKLSGDHQFTSKDLKNELRHKSRLLSELTKNDAKVSKKLARQSEQNLELKTTNLKQKNMLLEKEAELANYKNQVQILTMALQNATQDKVYTQPASNQSSVRKDLLSSHLASFMGKEVSRFNPSRTSKHSHQNSEQIFPIAIDAQKFVTPKIRKGLDEVPPAPMHPRVSEMLIQEEYDKRGEQGISSRLDSSSMPQQRVGSLAGEMGSGRLTLFEEMEKKEKRGGGGEPIKKRVFNLSQIDSIFQTIKLFSENILQRGSETEIILIQELKNLFWSHLLLMSELQTKHQLLVHRDAENKDCLKLLQDFTGIYNALAKKYEILEVESNNRMMEAQIWESLQNKVKPREAMLNTFMNEPKPGLSNYDSAGGPSLTGLSTPQPHSRHSSSDIGFYFYNRNQACLCGAGTESVNSSECNSQGVLVHHHRCPSSKIQQLLKFKSLDQEQLFRELTIQHSKSFYYKQAYENRETQNGDLRQLNQAVNSSASQLVLECQRDLQNSFLKIQSLKLINQQLRHKLALGQARTATIDLVGDRPQGDLSPAVIEMSSSSNASSSSTLYPAGNFLIEHARHHDRNMRENIYEIKPRKPW